MRVVIYKTGGGEHRVQIEDVGAVTAKVVRLDGDLLEDDYTLIVVEAWNVTVRGGEVHIHTLPQVISDLIEVVRAGE
ncbi:MAG: hypothetical protein QXH81_03475 [Thermofilaceae archaeon]